jgi:hypothetical protein
MPFALRHRHDPVAAPTPLAGLVVRRQSDANAMAQLQSRSLEEIERRFAAGNRAYIAELNGDPAAWGWVATRAAAIGELDVSFDIAEGERYLWNFVTLASHRGLGIYPRLLDAIVAAESGEAERFWVGYAPENHASGVGIRKAGFEAVSELSFDSHGRAAVRDLRPGGALLAARVLGLHESDVELAQCWRCVRAGKPKDMSCAGEKCRCDYQVPVSGCSTPPAA